MKKGIIWGTILLVTSIFVLLLWVQYSYYHRAISLRKEQTTQLAQLALADLADKMEFEELVRYLNQEFAASGLSLNNIRTPMEVDMQELKNNLPEQVDSAAFDIKLLNAYVEQRTDLDEAILKYLYQGFNFDSIPQYINPKFLNQTLRQLLNRSGVSVPYAVYLCDAKGKLRYQYAEPGMRALGNDESIIQKIFVQDKKIDQPSPFIRLTLDLSDNQTELYRFVLPGVILTVVVLVLGLVLIAVLGRQLSFHEMKTSFINNMTHELKTPISSISLAQQLLSEEGNISNAEKRSNLLGIIRMECKRLQTLVEKSLQFSVLNGRVGTLDLQEWDLNELILPVAETFSMHAQRLGGELDLDLDALHTLVNVDRTHMTNVLSNLLENSVKYAKPHGDPIRLMIKTRNVSSLWIQISIEDNGIGIPKESLTKIFERYYRVPTGHKHDVKGYGLGLAYVKTVVKQFGGNIHAENRREGGTRMIVRLPLALESEA